MRLECANQQIADGEPGDETCCCPSDFTPGHVRLTLVHLRAFTPKAHRCSSRPTRPQGTNSAGAQARFAQYSGS